MRILVTKRMYGREDGKADQWYEAGKTYDMGEDLAVVFLREGWGESAESPAAPAEFEEAGQDESGEKAVDTAPNDKARRPRANK